MALNTNASQAALDELKGMMDEENTKKETKVIRNANVGYLPLKVNKQNVPVLVRLINPIVPRHYKDWVYGSGQARAVNLAWIVDDNGKKKLICLPRREDDPADSHIFYRFVDEVMKSRKIEGTKDRLYLNKGSEVGADTGKSIGDIFTKVSTSDDTSGIFSPVSWAGKEKYICNVIDRNDPQYHKDTGKTKVLVKSVTVKDGVPRPKEASSFTILDPLKKVLASAEKTPEEIDVVIMCGKESLDKADIWNASELVEANYTKAIKDLVDVNKVVVGPLTPEEINGITPEDLDYLYPITTYRQLIKWVGKTIQRYDELANTNFYAEMKRKADLEAEADEVAPKTEEAAQPAPTEQVLQPPAPTRTRAPVMECKSEGLNEYGCDNDISALSEQDREYIDWDNCKKEGNTIVEWAFKPEAGTLYECSECHTKSPELMTHCPHCGAEF